MASTREYIIYYRKIGRDTFFVEAESKNGSRRGVGTVKRFYAAHLRQETWEATASNGDHHAVHAERWMAAMSLTVSATDYHAILHPARPMEEKTVRR